MSDNGDWLKCLSESRRWRKAGSVARKAKVQEEKQVLWSDSVYPGTIYREPWKKFLLDGNSHPSPFLTESSLHESSLFSSHGCLKESGQNVYRLQVWTLSWLRGEAQFKAPIRFPSSLAKCCLWGLLLISATDQQTEDEPSIFISQGNLDSPRIQTRYAICALLVRVSVNSDLETWDLLERHFVKSSAPGN